MDHPTLSKYFHYSIRYLDDFLTYKKDRTVQSQQSSYVTSHIDLGDLKRGADDLFHLR